MNKIIFAFFAATMTAFAALAPASAGPTRLDANITQTVIKFQNELRADAGTPCRVERRWRYDYAGKPYVKKVRVCA